jgi:ABC-2 type transport system permease protein
MLLFFPLLFFAGVYVPLQVMPEGVQTVSGYTPTGAAVQALSDSWTGSVPATSDLVVLAAYAVGTGVLAVRLFRWD